MVDLLAGDGSSNLAIPTTTAEWLKHVRERTSLAVAAAAMVKAFPGRWSSIRTRLEQLPCHLANLEECCCSGIHPANHSLSNELLQNIAQSLVEATDLAERCIEEAYGGKLQMQSCLDALALKLGMHVQECEMLVKSGVLRDTIPPSSRTSSGGTKEAVKWSVRDALARLQIGKIEMKHKAIGSLVELMQEDDKNVLVVAGEENGIPTLVHLLDARVATLREKASVAVHRLSQIESCQKLLVPEGVLAPLVRLVEAGSSLAKEKASETLKSLTSNPENARSVAGHGGISALVEICQTGTPAAQAAAAGALKNLAGIPSVRETLAEEEGAIGVLIGLVTSGTPLAQEHACDALQSLSLEESLREEMIKEGAIQALLMNYDTTSSPRGKEVAMGALSNLAAFATNVKEILDGGFLIRILTALQGSIALEQEAAAYAVCRIARSMELRKTLGDAGFIPPLVRMLQGKTTTMQELASQAIFNLILVDSNRRAFCKEEGCISMLVELLDPCNQLVGKKFPLSALLCLSGKKKCRKQMVAAGARGYLAKLADMEITGARKLLERLGGSKLWTLFRV